MNILAIIKLLSSAETIAEIVAAMKEIKEAIQAIERLVNLLSGLK